MLRKMTHIDAVRHLSRSAVVRRQGGFSLIELMVAMLVGLIIVGGVFSLHTSTRKTERVNEAQMDMAADARFAIDLISYDLRHAGMWGATNKSGLIECKSTDTACTATSNGDTPPSNIEGDCEAGWYYNLGLPVHGIDSSEGNPYSTTCIPSGEKYLAGTDLLEIRYADANTPPALLAGQAHVRSNFVNGRIFIGATKPKLSSYDSDSITSNHVLHAFAYYISDYSDAPGDDIPSLRRVALVNGPKVENQLLISGVVDLQVQFGEDRIGNDRQIDRYVDADKVADWQNVFAVKVWVVMRTDEKQRGVDTSKTFFIAGQEKSYGGVDDYRYFMVSSVIDLRNLKTSL